MPTVRENKNAPIITNLRIKSLGIIYCSLVAILILFSFPVYIFRLVIIFVARYFRSDFGDIVNGQSALFVGDYLDGTTPRSNLVLSMIFEGQLTLEQVRALVLQNWISNIEYKKFQQYPVKWMGFTFWRNIPNPFLVNDYIHEYSGENVQVKDQELDELTEMLLNRKLVKNQSPWELHLIQNYRNTSGENESKVKTKPQSVLIFKWHHCLVDGTGIVAALVEGLFQQRWTRKLETLRPEKPTWQKLLLPVTLPGMILFELSSLLSYTFVNNPFKVPDRKKEWHQVYSRSGLIPNQLVKDIKNAFGVSYTSVIISAISAAVRKTGMQTNESVYFLSVLPARGISKRKILSNHMTSTMLDIPTTSYINPVERLSTVDKLFEESRKSVKPILVQFITSLMGSHLYSVNKFITNNRMIPIGLTNIAGVQSNIQLNDTTKWIHTRTVAGCLSGDCGIGITAFSHGQNTEIHIAAERALMTKKQAQEFLQHVRQEVEALGSLVSENL